MPAYLIIATSAIALACLTLCISAVGLMRLRRFEKSLSEMIDANPLSRLSDDQIREHIRLIQSGECDSFIYHAEEDRWEPVLNK